MASTFADLTSTWPSTRGELADWLKEAIDFVRTPYKGPVAHILQLVHHAYRLLLDLGAPADTLDAVVMPVSGDYSRLFGHVMVEVMNGYPDTLARLHAAHEWAATTPAPVAPTPLAPPPTPDRPGEVSEQAERVRNRPPAQREAVQKYLSAKNDLEQLTDGPPVTWRELARTAGVRDEDFAAWKRTATNGLRAAGIPTHAQPGGRESRSAVRPPGQERVGKSGKTG
jgi:hypothetical protein